MMFLHIAEGIDDRTWKHHLKAGDYSGWFRDKVKDDELADEAAGIEADGSLDPQARAAPASPKRCCAATRFRPTSQETLRALRGSLHRARRA